MRLIQSVNLGKDADFMEKNAKIGFVGGDRRMLECAKEMSRHGFETAVCGFEEYGSLGDLIKTDLSGAVTGSCAVVLPLPCCSHADIINSPYGVRNITFSEVLDKCSDCTVFCGKPPKELRSEAQQRGIALVDYYESERLQILNAIPTAEGALCAAMENSDITLRSSECLVTGYGRISKLLCEALKALGAEVTVCARSEEALTWAKVNGYAALHISALKNAVMTADFVFNTVPSRLFGRQELDCVREDTLLIELASQPGGFDREYAEVRSLKIIYALGLPGKNSPKSAGIYISEVLLDCLAGD